MTAAVLIPVKSFTDAKRRLGDVLDAPSRARLARELATVVVHAAAPLPAYVLCHDEAVADWARDVGAEPVLTPADGLDAAVSGGVDLMRERSVTRVVIAHADLPFARDLARFADPTDPDDRVVIVPDRHRNGTNLLALGTRHAFPFSYGPGSFGRHVATATAAGLELRVVEDPHLAWDVDNPDDLTPPPRLGPMPTVTLTR